MDPFERIFQLHRLLGGRRVGISFADLQTQLGCTRSTLRRTLNYLRDALHAPLINDRSRGGYLYEAGHHYELPGLWFSAQELTALLLIEDIVERQPLGLLSDTLRPFRARLERLASQTEVGIVDWRRRLHLQRIAARPPGPAFDVVADALVRRRQLQIDYHARSDDRMAPRVVSPQRLTLYRDNWYLDAWCHYRNESRVFALDRIIAAETLPETAIEIDAAALEQALAASYGIFAGPATEFATLRFTPYAARWVRNEIWHPDQIDETTADGGLTRRIPYHRSDELLMDLLRHGPNVEVLAPETLRSQLIKRLEDSLRQYRAGGAV